MATTSPDNLFSPNPSDNYNLIADWATSMQSVQAALVKRANMYVGTSTQRTAFTTAPEGVHWQDTNGVKDLFIRQSGAWVPIPYRVESAALTISGVTPSYNPTVYKSAGRVNVEGAVSQVPTSNTWVKITTLPLGFRPLRYQLYPAGANSPADMSTRVHLNGDVEVYTTIANSSAALPLTGISFIAA